MAARKIDVQPAAGVRNNWWQSHALARLYKEKYSSLIRMGKLLFARALFADEAKRNNVKVTQRLLLALTRKERLVGKRSASLVGWHSCRTSFVTLALLYNIPLEMVRSIVGHTMTNTTLMYFHATKSIVAETVHRQLAGSVLYGATAALPCEIKETEDVLTLSIPVPEMSEPSISQ